MIRNILVLFIFASAVLLSACGGGVSDASNTDDAPKASGKLPGCTWDVSKWDECTWQ